MLANRWWYFIAILENINFCLHVFYSILYFPEQLVAHRAQLYFFAFLFSYCFTFSDITLLFGLVFSSVASSISRPSMSPSPILKSLWTTNSWSNHLIHWEVSSQHLEHVDPRSSPSCLWLKNLEAIKHFHIILTNLRTVDNDFTFSTLVLGRKLKDIIA